MKKLLTLVLVVMILIFSFSCAKKSKGTKPNTDVGLEITVDYFGQEKPTFEDLKNITIQVYKNESDKDSGVPPTFEYSGGDVVNGVVDVPLDSTVVVLTKTDSSQEFTYIFEDADYDFSETKKELRIDKIVEKKKILIIFSDVDLTIESEQRNIRFINNKPGGEIEFYVVRKKDDEEIKSFTKVFQKSSSTKEGVAIPKWLQKNGYALNVRAKPEVFGEYIYEVNSWEVYKQDTSGSGIKQPHRDYILPIEETYTVIGVEFKVADVKYGVGVEPIKTRVRSDGQNWYEIQNKDQLLYVANKLNDGDRSWEKARLMLMNDIDYDGEWHRPIGGVTVFQGVIDGNGYSLKNAKIGINFSVADSYSGFVGSFKLGAISNLTIDRTVVIESIAGYIGGIVGSADIGSRIVNCVNRASIKRVKSADTNPLRVGGIAGYIFYKDAFISNVYNSGNIEIDSAVNNPIFVGGIIGNTYGMSGNGVSINMQNIGNITYTGSSTDFSIGGIVGFMKGSSTTYTYHATNAYSTGNINASGNHVGGVIGRTDVATYDVKYLYFVNKNSLPANGLGKGSGFLSGVGTSPGVNNSLTYFNAITPAVWVKSGEDIYINGVGKIN